MNSLNLPSVFIGSGLPNLDHLTRGGVGNGLGWLHGLVSSMEPVTVSETEASATDLELQIELAPDPCDQLEALAQRVAEIVTSKIMAEVRQEHTSWTAQQYLDLINSNSN